MLELRLLGLDFQISVSFSFCCYTDNIPGSCLQNTETKDYLEQWSRITEGH